MMSARKEIQKSAEQERPVVSWGGMWSPGKMCRFQIGTSESREDPQNPREGCRIQKRDVESQEGGVDKCKVQTRGRDSKGDQQSPGNGCKVQGRDAECQERGPEEGQ